MDDNLQHGGVHVDVDCESPNDPLRLVIEGDVTTCSRKCTSEYCGDGKGKKESRLGQMGDALKSWAETFKVWFEAFKAKIEALLARVEKYKGGTSTETTSSSGTHEFSLTKWMSALENIRLLDNDKYMKVVEKFTFIEWREIFMNMLDERKKTWIDRL